MNQRQGFYQVDTERTDNNGLPYRVTDALLVVAFIGVIGAFLGGFL